MQNVQAFKHIRVKSPNFDCHPAANIHFPALQHRLSLVRADDIAQQGGQRVGQFGLFCLRSQKKVEMVASSSEQMENAAEWLSSSANSDLKFATQGRQQLCVGVVREVP